MKKVLWLAAPLVLALGVMTGGVAGFAASSAPLPAPPGQGDCSHGSTGKSCRPDPQPEQGKDCDTHGNDGIGGINEDHCLATSPTSSTDVTTTSQTATNESTSSATTTTNKTTTPDMTTSGTVTTAESAADGPSAAAPAVTKTQLEAEPAKQAAKVGTGRVSPEPASSGQLPFTGSSVWILALLGSAMLTAGLAVRRLTA